MVALIGERMSIIAVAINNVLVNRSEVTVSTLKVAKDVVSKEVIRVFTIVGRLLVADVALERLDLLVSPLHVSK